MSLIMTYFHWELKLAYRTGGTLVNGLSFFTIYVFLIPIGMTNEVESMMEIAPGVLWLACLLSVIISLEKLFILDIEDGTLEKLYLSKLPLETIIVIKMFVHWLTTGLPLVVASPIFAYLLKMPQDSYIWLFISLLIGTPALSFIGTIGAALTIGAKRGGVLLAIIVIPLYLPTLIFGTKMVQSTVSGDGKIAALIFLLAITLFSLAIGPFLSAYAIKSYWRF